MDTFARLLRPLALLVAIALCGAPAAAQTATLPLAPPPAAPNAAAGAIFDAMLAISRATLTNPAAAQAAAFNYAAAIQRYNAGDLQAARMDALQAISATAQSPLHPQAAVPPLTAVPAYTRVPSVPTIVNPAQADADAFLAVSRRALATCAVTGGPQRAQLQTLYEKAVREDAAQSYNDVREDARAIINGCATPLQPHGGKG